MIKVDLNISDILNNPPPLQEIKLPEIDPTEFEKVVDTRRSVRLFDNTPVPEWVMEKSFDLALLAPSASNFCPWEFHWIQDPQKKSQVRDYAFNQPAIRTAQEIVVCTVRTKTWNKHRLQILKFMNESNIRWPNWVRFYYEKITYLCYQQGPLGILGFIKKPLFLLTRFLRIQSIPPCSEQEMVTWAVKGGAFAQQNFMLALRAYGFDSCAMEGYDEMRIKKLLQLPKDAHVSMLIGVGKRDITDQFFGPRIRMDRSWHVFKH